MSEIILTDLPRGLNSQSGFVRLPFSPWKVTRSLLSGSASPCRLINSGL